MPIKQTKNRLAGDIRVGTLAVLKNCKHSWNNGVCVKVQSVHGPDDFTVVAIHRMHRGEALIVNRFRVGSNQLEVHARLPNRAIPSEERHYQGLIRRLTGGTLKWVEGKFPGQPPCYLLQLGSVPDYCLTVKDALAKARRYSRAQHPEARALLGLGGGR